MTQSLILFFSVSFIVLGVFLKVFLNQRGQQPSRVSSKSPDISTAFSEFQSKLSAVGKKIQILDEHASEYHAVFSQQGYGELSKLYTHLCNVYNLLVELMQTGGKKGKYDTVEILEWLTSRNFGGSTPVLIEQLVGSDAPLLKTWEPHLNDLVVKITIALSEAAEQTQELGIKRTRKRQPTLMAVKELVDPETLAKFFQQNDW